MKLHIRISTECPNTKYQFKLSLQFMYNGNALKFHRMQDGEKERKKGAVVETISKSQKYLRTRIHHA